MKGLLSLFDIKTDRIYNTISTGKCIGDRPLIVDIGFDRLRYRTTRRPTNPVPPNTVTTRWFMAAMA
jgi:hypothetical protein